jgi:DNA-binding NarL/FixJ family response regulator
MSRVLGYAKSNPGFRKKLLDTYPDLPYPVQARADMFSPRVFEEVKRLKSKGLSNREIGGKVGVSEKTVGKRLKEIGSKPKEEQTQQRGGKDQEERKRLNEGNHNTNA